MNTTTLHSYLSQPGKITDRTRIKSGIEGIYSEYDDGREIDFHFCQVGDKVEIMLDVFRECNENHGTGPMKMFLEVSPRWDADGDYIGEEWIRRVEAQAFGKRFAVDMSIFKRSQIRFEQIAFDLVQELFSIEDAAEYRARD